ncbi:hypothetical protein Purlil1_13605 [Purpureocillium lilacinum]|uniref:Major facilitator superfamily (MFS) profile domain-containing protein n=1 Tax=Purpureocillium lilacinum TaxID=33203 RepID=A0ABR0BDL1_PURLI|nr:hypothetical protein Purlil1_13605 [Purpureocillium lilacinum]
MGPSIPLKEGEKQLCDPNIPSCAESTQESTQDRTESGCGESDSIPDETPTDVYTVSNPRRHIAEWKWRGTIVVICLTSMISGIPYAVSPSPEIRRLTPLGYDVSNVATIQTRLYETLGHIELLEWISLSFSLAVFASLSLARKIVYCFDLRWVYLANLGIFFVGSALAGAAPNMAMVIIGRSIMGAGGTWRTWPSLRRQSRRRD